MSEIAVAVFSWGGISNLFAAARDNRIDALVARERINSFSRTVAFILTRPQRDTKAEPLPITLAPHGRTSGASQVDLRQQIEK